MALNDYYNLLLPCERNVHPNNNNCLESGDFMRLMLMMGRRQQEDYHSFVIQKEKSPTN